MTLAPTPLRRRHPPHPVPLALAGVLLVALTALAAILLVRHHGFGGSSGSGAVRGSGVAATQSRELPPFSGVELAGSNSVVVRVGGRQSVIVHADDNLLRHVTTVVRSGNLTIGNAPGSFTADSPMSVEISVPSLETLTLSGSGVIAATGVKARRLTVTLPGSGVLHASGRSAQLAVSLGGSGEAELEQLTARDVRAVLTGSGRILVTATNGLDASVPGSGTIVYSGNPRHVATSVTGNGAVTPG